MHVLIWTQHLLGIGHLRRAERLAKGLVARGHAVTLVSGGPPVGSKPPDGLALVQLPPINVADERFATLIDPDGVPVDDAYWQSRLNALLATLERAPPAAVVIEMYPFGRRAFAREVQPFLERARDLPPRPLAFCSLRDVLVQKRQPGRAEAVAALCRRHFDAVLVHSDPRLIPLEASFPATASIRDLIRYTGYIADAPSLQEATPADLGDGVLVSAGGGAVGGRLLQVASRAAALVGPNLGHWDLIGGGGLDPAAAAEIEASLPTHARLHGHLTDLPERLARCRLAVSQAGYNTVIETLVAGRPMVLVPFAAGEETEQTTRAEVIAAKGIATVLAEHDLSAEMLAEAISARALAPVPKLDLATDGAERSAALIERMVQAKSGRL